MSALFFFTLICIFIQQCSSLIPSSEGVLKFCVDYDSRDETCEIEGNDETCHYHGKWNKDGGRCDCFDGYTGAYCQACAVGSDPANCTRCYENRGMVGDPIKSKCYYCPCLQTPGGYARAIGSDYGVNGRTKIMLKEGIINACTDVDGTIYPASSSSDVAIAQCICKEGWGGPFCLTCADDYYPRPEYNPPVPFRGAPCSVPCSAEIKCGGLGLCNGLGECVCKPGSYKFEGGCKRCDGSALALNSNVDGVKTCEEKFIPDPVVLPAPMSSGGSLTPGVFGAPTPGTPIEEKKKKGCQKKPKWWIGVIIAGSIALLLALIAGAVLLILNKPKGPNEV